MDKPYKFTVICGRFQPLHIGHKHIIDLALSLSEQVGLYLGSSNNCNTTNNPLTYEERYVLINKIYNFEITSKALIVKPLNDRKNPINDHDWGKYYLECIKNDFNKKPSLFIYGNDKERNKWFTENDLSGIDTLIVNRNSINISATQIRNMILSNNPADKLKLRKYLPKEIYSDYNFIRDKLIKINEK